jgi:hypothetical protein
MNDYTGPLRDYLFLGRVDVRSEEKNSDMVGCLVTD